MKPAQSLSIENICHDEEANEFCEKFIYDSGPKYIFGINEYAASIAKAIDISGFIDDFTNETTFLGKQIIKTCNIPKDAMVVSVVIGRPLTAEKKLKEKNIEFLDYFSFQHHASVDLLPVKFWEEFRQDFYKNRQKYENIYSKLADDKSKTTLNKIINFRLTQNINHMRGFSDTQHQQYFEDFLNLDKSGEIFVDVGGFDGYTSLEFIKRCPDYKAIHIFEPEPENMAITKQNLSGQLGIHFYPAGLSNLSETLHFSAGGSTSKIQQDGELKIQVERLDDIISTPFTFLKMDIEGSEKQALEGMKEAILMHHPRLAICVYHDFDDLWRIPELVLSYRDDYKLHLRHYTEGVDETVMFFTPHTEFI